MSSCDAFSWASFVTLPSPTSEAVTVTSAESACPFTVRDVRTTFDGKVIVQPLRLIVPVGVPASVPFRVRVEPAA